MIAVLTLVAFFTTTVHSILSRDGRLDALLELRTVIRPQFYNSPSLWAFIDNRAGDVVLVCVLVVKLHWHDYQCLVMGLTHFLIQVLIQSYIESFLSHIISLSTDPDSFRHCCRHISCTAKQWVRKCTCCLAVISAHWLVMKAVSLVQHRWNTHRDCCITELRCMTRHAVRWSWIHFNTLEQVVRHKHHSEPSRTCVKINLPGRYESSGEDADFECRSCRFVLAVWYRLILIGWPEIVSLIRVIGSYIPSECMKVGHIPYIQHPC